MRFARVNLRLGGGIVDCSRSPHPGPGLGISCAPAVCQGAESGEFVQPVHQLLLGKDGFYDDIFTSLRLPNEPVRWATDLDIITHGLTLWDLVRRFPR